MKRMIKWCLLFALYCGLFGCGGGSNGANSGSGLTANQIEEIENSSKSITEKLATAAEPGSETALNDAKALALTLANVESANVVDGCLEVKYKDGGREVWIENVPAPTVPADIPEITAQTTVQAASSRVMLNARAANRKAILINTLYDDPNFASHRNNFTGMKSALEGAGFAVTELNGSAATPDELGRLADYSVIIYNGHGMVSADGNDYAMSTGKDWDYDESVLWTEDKCVKITVEWDKFPNRHSRSLYGITGKFWRLKYENSHLIGSLFLNSACKGAKVDPFMHILKDIGVSAYAGWSWFDGIGNSSNQRVLELMAGGKTLQQAYDDLPFIYKRELITGFISTFTLSPYSDTTFTLGAVNPSHPDIRIDSPTGGASLSDRSCMVSGQITPNAVYSFANVIVNGQSEVLSVNTDGSFEQAVGLRAGENIITIATRGNVEYQKSVTVTGDFSSDILFTTLWWNTDFSDIDLHLVPIEGANGARDECFFGNMITTWGATLDVDDVNGFGPEHITARTLPPGKYMLYVHYFATHGQTAPTTVNVAVSAQGQQSIIFTLNGDRRMSNQGDIWRICTIEYPSGTIQTLDEFLPGNGTVSLMSTLRSKK